jgi:hypothetical protein
MAFDRCCHIIAADAEAEFHFASHYAIASFRLRHAFHAARWQITLALLPRYCQPLY